MTPEASPSSSSWFARLPPTARLLIVCRAARSLGQGALVVDFALYLHALQWTEVEIGALYMGGLMLNAGLTLLSGPLSDVWGRKPFLIFYGIAQSLAAVTALTTSQPIPLLCAALVGAFGRGANGAAGPFGPVEQAWLSECLMEKDFGSVYSLNAAAGFGGMAAGALIAAAPALWAQSLPGALQFRPLFFLPLLAALTTLVLLPFMADVRRRPAATRALLKEKATEPSGLERRGMLLRLVAVNALNGLGSGVIGPFMALWFHLRYGEGALEIGPVIALGFTMSSLASLLTGRLARRLGVAMAVASTSLVGVVLLALMPFAPTYGLAAACYVMRAAFNRGSAGARQTVGLRLAGPKRRGLGASLNAASSQIPRALGPVLGGVLLQTNLLILPLLISAALQAVYLVLYAAMFRRLD